MASAPLLYVLLPSLIIILIGKLVSLRWLRDPKIWNSIDQLNFRLLIPCLIVSILAKSNLDSYEVDQIAAVILLTLGLIAIGLFALYRLNLIKDLSAASFSSVFQTSTRWNTTIAIVLISQLFGDSYLAIIAVIMVMFMPLANVLNITMLIYLLNNDQNSLVSYISKILKNPIIVSCLVGIALSYSPIQLSNALLTGLNRLGQASVATALLSLGAGISFNMSRTGLMAITTSCIFKLVVMPVLVMILALLIGIEHKLACVMALSLAAPTAMNGYVVAKEMGGDAPLYANISSIQTLFSFITLPAWVASMKYWVT
ncbi:AEC family transporter [Reinekea marinisedimentorum]|uniref:Permease n=1 Tax=Reinekea marinisedimentorum TaxID=230495 RepID=A0A4R3I2G3_9GAMM|nr:AEC family transporter [Reinekea marinisedimentorum]TCS39976.1 hypothetical protein BCF53_11167 [Reinekea marinisedimentorum]